MKKVSISHLEVLFDKEVQGDFLIAYIKRERLDVLYVIEAGTGYREKTIVSWKMTTL